MNELDRSVSLDEAAKLLGCSRRKTWNLIQAGELPASKIGHRWSIRQCEVLAYHQKCKLPRPKNTCSILVPDQHHRLLPTPQPQPTRVPRAQATNLQRLHL